MTLAAEIEADEDIALAIVGKLAVESLYFLRHLLVFERIVAIGSLHIDHIPHLVRLAMTQRHIRPEQTLIIGDLRQVFDDRLVFLHDGTYLQQVHLARAIGIEVAGKLYLYRALHRIGTKLHGELHQLGQGEDSLLEHASKGDDLATTLP